MGAAVEPLPLPRVGEPEVGAAVDDHDVVGQLGGDLTRLAVGQAEEDHVVSREGLEVGGSRIRSASGTRCGCSDPSGCPALEPPVSAPISTPG